MSRPSVLLTRVGSALIILGGVVIVLAALSPDAAPPVPITVIWPDIPTPSPAYLGTPLSPPGGRPGQQEVALVLPVMPVEPAAEELAQSPGGTTTASHAAPFATPSGALSGTPSNTPTRRPTATPTPSRTPTATRSPLPPSRTTPPTGTATRTATRPAPRPVTPSATLTPTPTPTRTPSPTPTPRPRPPDRIVIPSLGVDAPVQPVGWHTIELDGQTYGQWNVPDGYAAGWHNTSAPLGVPGNTVLNGHHNIEGEVFGRLIELVPGDRLTLYGGGRAFHYVVAQTMVLLERWQVPEERLENARWILPSDDERVTLVTCWPHNGNSHRLIVVAVPAEETGTAPQE